MCILLCCGEHLLQVLATPRLQTAVVEGAAAVQQASAAMVPQALTLVARAKLSGRLVAVDHL